MAETFDTSSLQDSLNLPFPATTKQTAGLVNGVQTDVVIMNFSDKIMVTISQAGRLAHWVCLEIGFNVHN
jgi:proteasome assembly chaperone 3